MTASKGLRAYAYVLAVPDLAASASYFGDVLGFVLEWADGDNWRAMARDGARIMLGRSPDALPPASRGDHSYFAYLHVDDIDAFHDEIAAKGAIIRHPPRDQPWGLREMAIATPDGHRMMIGTPL